MIEEGNVMSITLSERLQAERDRWFTGRYQEYTCFQSALSALSNDIELPFHLLYLFGVGGIGKTTLLRRFIYCCNQIQIKSIYLDARNIEPSASAFVYTLQEAINIPFLTDSAKQFPSYLEHTVLLIDTYETLEPLEDWFRETFLPQLPATTLIVMASRFPPAAAWRTDSGWRSLIHILPLRNFSPAESQQYLALRKIPHAHHPAILEFTHGHPLALSLMVDVSLQAQGVSIQPEAEIDSIQILLKRFIGAVPTPTHRKALEACVLVRILTEAVLQEMLGLTDAHDLFEWLSSLSFIESNAFGLFPHDLAREVLSTDLRRRNLDWYVELHHRARSYYVKRLEQTQGQSQHHRILLDYIFLHRDNPCVRLRFNWYESSRLSTDRLRETDREILRQMVKEHEGEGSARIFDHWLKRQPQGVIVIRDAQQHITGFVMMVALHQATQADLVIDPGAIASWRYLQDCTVLRSGEGAILFRYWMARDTYQSVSPTQTLIFINLIHYYRTTPGLAFTFLPCADPDFWREMLTYADLTRLPKAEFELDGRYYGVYGHDWRVISPAAWQALLARREIAAVSEAGPDPESSRLLEHGEPILVLSQSEFVEAVQAAFRQFSAPIELSKNPLLRSRLILESQNSGSAIATLQSLIHEATATLESCPRQHKFYRVLYRTYFQPAPTQEAAAESLNIPFSTYRRYLKTGVQQVAEYLWSRELRCH